MKNFKLKGINISTLKEKNFLFLKDVIDLFDTEEEHKLVEQQEEPQAEGNRGGGGEKWGGKEGGGEGEAEGPT